MYQVPFKYFKTLRQDNKTAFWLRTQIIDKFRRNTNTKTKKQSDFKPCSFLFKPRFIGEALGHLRHFQQGGLTFILCIWFFGKITY